LHRLPDDSVIVVLGQENKHRFEVPVDRSNDKPGHGNKLTMSIRLDKEPPPLGSKKNSVLYFAYQKDPGGGIVPEDSVATMSLSLKDM
jgi:hypothetical protein